MCTIGVYIYYMRDYAKDQGLEEFPQHKETLLSFCPDSLLGKEDERAVFENYVTKAAHFALDKLVQHGGMQVLLQPNKEINSL